MDHQLRYEPSSATEPDDAPEFDRLDRRSAREVPHPGDSRHRAPHRLAALPRAFEPDGSHGSDFGPIHTALRVGSLPFRLDQPDLADQPLLGSAEQSATGFAPLFGTAWPARQARIHTVRGADPAGVRG